MYYKLYRFLTVYMGSNTLMCYTLMCSYDHAALVEGFYALKPCI